MCVGPNNDLLLDLLLPVLFDVGLLETFGQQQQLEVTRTIGICSVSCATVANYDPMPFCRGILLANNRSPPLGLSRELQAGALHCWCLLSFALSNEEVCYQAADFLLDAVLCVLSERGLCVDVGVNRAVVMHCGLTLARILEATIRGSLFAEKLSGACASFRDCVSLFNGACKQFLCSPPDDSRIDCCHSLLMEDRGNYHHTYLETVRLTGASIAITEIRVAVVVDCMRDILGPVSFHGILNHLPIAE